MADEVKTNGFNKKKVQGFISEWDKIEAEASSKIGVIMAKAKSLKDDILEAAEGIGIKRKVFRNVVNEHKLREKADAMRDEFAENNEEDVVDQRDNVALAAGLTLFEAAGVDAPEKKKPAKKKAKDKAGSGDQLSQIADAIEGRIEETSH